MDARLLARVAPAFARLFGEPDDGFREEVDEARALLSDLAPDAADLVRRFAEDTAGDAIDVMRERHTRTFDLAPACVPYLSVHLFGEESFKRARLMTGLAGAYRTAGFDPGPELPDHLSVVLRFVPAMTPAEQDDLAELVLKPGVERMARALSGGANPYRYLLDALTSVIQSRPEVEAAHA